MRGLVIGRFQPLHKGHEAVIRAAIEDCVHVVVGVGSSNARQSTRDPFSYDERAAMVRTVFGDAVEVMPVPDIHDPPNWADHVLDTVGPVDRVFGNDERTLSLFEDAGVPVRRTGLLGRTAREGTAIRAQIAEDDRAWRDAVSPPVIRFLEDLGAGQRLRGMEVRA